MPYPELERAAEIERQIKALVARIFELERRGRSALALQRDLDRLSRELAILKTPRESYLANVA